MPATRSSARLAGESPQSKGLEEATAPRAGRKRKAGSSSQPSKKRKENEPENKQSSLDQFMDVDGASESKDLEVKSAPDERDRQPEGFEKEKSEELVPDKGDATKGVNESKEDNLEEQSGAANSTRNDQDARDDKDTQETNSAQDSSSTQEVKDSQDARDDNGTQENNSTQDGSSTQEVKDSHDAPKSAVMVSPQREKVIPSNIVEKGIIYFFTRGRVNNEDPESTSDLQRTYFVLRPLPKGAKLADGPLSDSQHNRLFALPKKTFPKGHSDRFMAFVEKGNTTIQSLKETFFQGYTYETKTKGTQFSPPVTPIGEGIYAITDTERSTHLVYMLAIPSELGEVQKDLGLSSKGSFIMSVKNPERPGPASARLPKTPEYPKEFIEEFRGLAWVPVKSKYLDYDNAQILLIGEGKKDNLGNAIEPFKEDQNSDKETPLEEIEKLEHEEEIRVHHLHGDDTIFDDLHISKNEYPDVKTTW